MLYNVYISNPDRTISTKFDVTSAVDVVAFSTGRSLFVSGVYCNWNLFTPRANKSSGGEFHLNFIARGLKKLVTVMFDGDLVAPGIQTLHPQLSKGKLLRDSISKQ